MKKDIEYSIPTHSESGYSLRHGGPYDRGSADAYYRRHFNPHFFEGDTYKTPRITVEKGTPEYEAYQAGWNEQDFFKDWG